METWRWEALRLRHPNLKAPTSNILVVDKAGRWTDYGRALFSYRDNVYGRLFDDERSGLLGEGDLGFVDRFEWLLSIGVVNGICGITDFGKEIARILREDGH